MSDYAYTATARITRGQLYIEARKAFDEALSHFPDGEYAVTVEPSSPRKRTLAQNAYLHTVVFPIAAEWMGQGIAETKLDLMGACWGWKESKMGNLIPEKPSTSQRTVEETTYFIDWVVPFLGSHGVRVPLPREA